MALIRLGQDAQDEILRTRTRLVLKGMTDQGWGRLWFDNFGIEHFLPKPRHKLDWFATLMRNWWRPQ